MIHDSIESSGITSHPISWQLATIDFANIDRLRRKLCGLKQQAPCTQKPKKFKGERTHQPNARIRTKIYRNLKPKVPWHDPYILALLIALAQQQHREERYNNRWTRYKVCLGAAIVPYLRRLRCKSLRLRIIRKLALSTFTPPTFLPNFFVGFIGHLRSSIANLSRSAFTLSTWTRKRACTRGSYTHFMRKRPNRNSRSD